MYTCGRKMSSWKKQIIQVTHRPSIISYHRPSSGAVRYRIYRYLPFYVQIPQPSSNREGPYSDCKFSTTSISIRLQNLSWTPVDQTVRNGHLLEDTIYSNTGVLFNQIMSKTLEPLLSTLGTCVILLL